MKNHKNTKVNFSINDMCEMLGQIEMFGIYHTKTITSYLNYLMRVTKTHVKLVIIVTNIIA